VLVLGLIPSSTEMTSVFNFFLCVVADDAALQEIKEVMIGGFLGTLSGAGFAALAGYARFAVPSLLRSATLTHAIV
jgi:hypothetical protein